MCLWIGEFGVSNDVSPTVDFCHFEKFFFLEHQLMMWIVFWFEFWGKTWIWKYFFFLWWISCFCLQCVLWFVKQKNGRKRNMNCKFLFWICVILCTSLGEISSTDDVSVIDDLWWVGEVLFSEHQLMMWKFLVLLVKKHFEYGIFFFWLQVNNTFSRISVICKTWINYVSFQKLIIQGKTWWKKKLLTFGWGETLVNDCSSKVYWLLMSKKFILRKLLPKKTQWLLMFQQSMTFY